MFSRDCAQERSVVLLIQLIPAVERFSSANVRTDDTHFDVANALMSMSNSSYQSFTRPQSKVVDITDLREALGSGNTNHGTPSSPPSIISTVGGRSIRGDASPTKRQGPMNTDVQEVLKDIFKNSERKKKAKGLGMQAEAIKV